VRQEKNNIKRVKTSVEIGLKAINLLLFQPDRKILSRPIPEAHQYPRQPVILMIRKLFCPLLFLSYQGISMLPEA